MKKQFNNSEANEILNGGAIVTDSFEDGLILSINNPQLFSIRWA